MEEYEQKDLDQNQQKPTTPSEPQQTPSPQQPVTKRKPWLAPLIVLLIVATSAGAVALALSGKDSGTTKDGGSGTGDNTNGGTVEVDNVEATIALADGDSVSSDSSAVSVDGDMITINKGGEYTISGSLQDGGIVVNAANAEVTLILDGVIIANENGPAIVFANTVESYVVLADGSENILTDGMVEDENYDAALYSVASLTLSGNGTLTVNGRSQEGIATEKHMTFNGGTYYISAYDDGLNANQDNVSVITINDGFLHISADGDGIDSNGDLVVNGGTIITASALSDASGGLDADGTIEINGGTLIATGERNSTPASSSTQKSILASFGSNMAAGTKIAIRQGGTTIAAFELVRPTSELLFSSADIEDGFTYDIYSNVVLTGEVINSIYFESDGGSVAKSVTTSSVSSSSDSRPR